ncbi:MAG TPA: bifunctional nuclease family protein [Firmicutes bacterium]|nr:bifunctional nuclease family protein [Candidatus Fermentithermobacillaceae bacterium]
MVQVTIERVGLDSTTDQGVIILADLSKTTIIPIWVRTLEASAIALPLQGVVPPRPLTHDLLLEVIKKLGAKVVMVLIRELKDEVFYASLVLDVDGEREEIDCRPSDAMALALRAEAPIYVADSVIMEAGIPAEDSQIQ